METRITGAPGYVPTADELQPATALVRKARTGTRQREAAAPRGTRDTHASYPTPVESRKTGTSLTNDQLATGLRPGLASGSPGGRSEPTGGFRIGAGSPLSATRHAPPVVRDRQRDLHRCARVELAPDADLSAVVFDNLTGNGQAQTRPFGFGRVVRLRDTVELLHPQPPPPLRAPSEGGRL